MSVPLLTTKFYIPHPRPSVVSRPRLIEKLRVGLTRPRSFTLLSGPAGFGKTTLLSEYVVQLQQPVAWVSLDEDDNDPIRFWTYVLTACQTAQAHVADDALAQLHTLQPPPAEAILEIFINDMAGLSQDIVLVLDDYHAIVTQAIHAALLFLLDHLPDHLHLVLATRVDPPLPLARFRARDQIIELRTADLRFTIDETAVFFKEAMGLPLSPKEVAALEARTEGWIAGLQLAALSLQGYDNIPAFIERLTGSHHYILDYLTEEVLQRQPESLQTFLLETSVLDRLSGPLCDAVTGRSDSQHYLLDLERANLFIVPLDDVRTWYRYHHLFSDLLRGRLRELYPDRVPELHRRASAWYEENGLMAEAINHALAAQDLGRAARLIEAAVPPFFMRSEVETLLDWFTALPEDVVRARPTLCLYHAAVLMAYTDQFAVAEARLKQVANASLEPDLQGMASLLWSFFALARGDVAHTQTAVSEALAIYEQSTMAASVSGVPYLPIATLFAACSLAEVQATRGQLRAAIATFQRALPVAQHVTLEKPWSMMIGILHITLGELLYEWNDLDDAAAHVLEGIGLSCQTQNTRFELYGYLVLARIRQAQAKASEALELIQKAEQIMRSRKIMLQVVPNVARLVKLWIRQGNPDAAADWVHTYPLDTVAGAPPVPTFPVQAEAGSVAVARMFLAAGQLDQAAELLEAILARAEDTQQIYTVLEVLILQALTLHAQGITDRALAALNRALTLAEPEGYVRLFVDEGPPLAALLSKLLKAKRRRRLALATGVATPYIHRLLSLFPPSKSDRPTDMLLPAAAPRLTPAAPQSLIDPLSERELEVLRLIAAGQSNSEIAQELTVTVGTVKAHTASIYRKLDVRNRMQAVARAKALNLF